MVSEGRRILIIRVVEAVAITASALVFFSFLAPWLPPADSVGHFRHYLVLVIAILTVSQVMVGHRRAAAISGIAALAGVFSMPQLFAPESTSADANFEVVQANLKFNNADVRGLESVVASADAVALQEVSRYNDKTVSIITAEFPSHQRCALTDTLDVMVLSRHKSSSGGCGEGLAWMRLTVESQSVTVVSVHLHWPWPFGQRDQLDKLRTTLSELPQPMILAGDFNAAPWSAAVTDVARWSDTHIMPGVRNTFTTELPFVGIGLDLPIDHILVPKDFAMMSISTSDPIGSDHLPLRARISLPK